jgi:hypothetical protein
MVDRGDACPVEGEQDVDESYEESEGSKSKSLGTTNECSGEDRSG